MLTPQQAQAVIADYAGFETSQLHAPLEGADQALVTTNQLVALLVNWALVDRVQPVFETICKIVLVANPAYDLAQVNQALQDAEALRSLLERVEEGLTCDNFKTAGIQFEF